MKTMNLDDLIDQTKRISLTACPVQVEQNVLRRLRMAQTPLNSPFWVLPTSGLQLGAIALVMLFTFTSTLGLSILQAKQQSHRHQVTKALDFDVFNAHSLYQGQRSFR
jgi:hypothetical protein